MILGLSSSWILVDIVCSSCCFCNDRLVVGMYKCWGVFLGPSLSLWQNEMIATKKKLARFFERGLPQDSKITVAFLGLSFFFSVPTEQER